MNGIEDENPAATAVDSSQPDMKEADTNKQVVRGNDRRQAKSAAPNHEADLLIYQNLVVARDIAAQLREKAVGIREGDMREAESNHAASEDQMQLLQQVNSRLVIATIEAQKLSAQLQSTQTDLERAKNEADRANLAKSEFLSRMSHELRTPLNAILGFAQLLEAGLPTPTPTQNVRLQQIIKSGWYLLELINEILDLSVIESGKLLLSQERVLLFEVMRECQVMIEAQALARGIQVNFVPCDSTWTADADRTRIKQVLLNLLSNAIKYNREQGTVDVTCSANTPGRIRISIKDTGAGLPPEKLALLFQPFNRLGQENSDEEGTGIGLIVVKQLVELMGGIIGVESTVGVGSEFWFELLQNTIPRTVAALPVRAVSSNPLQAAAVQRTLLYVEDNPASLLLIQQILADYPQVRIMSASDGYHAISLARKHLPDVILMDIGLPDISGIEVLHILRQTPDTMSIPVIALSANAIPIDVMKGLDAGFFSYLTKPVKLDEFIYALDDALLFSAAHLVNTNETGHLQ